MFMLKFWQRDRLQNVMIHEFLRRGGRTIAENEGAILVEDAPSGILCVSAANEEAGREVMAARKSYDLVILSQPLMSEHAERRYGLVCEHPCHQSVYTRGEPMPLSGKLDISVANEAELETIAATYRFADREELEAARRRGMIFTAHADGKFCGYIGEHGEGSMGMLEIFPPFRGRGYATELESFMINKKLEAGGTPYCHIIFGNSASYALQKKLGLETADEPVLWTHRRGTGH